MIPSVSPEADWELSEGAIFYAREANAEVGLAFILEYEGRWRFCAATHIWAHFGGTVGAVSHYENFPTASFTTSMAKSLE